MFKLKDFNKIIFDQIINPNDDSGSFADKTQLTVKTNDVYLLNPVTLLAGEMSEFDPSFWSAYEGDDWLDLSYPDEVIQHTQNHYRATSLVMLRRMGMTGEIFDRILNVSLGYPFALVSGILEIDSSDPTDYYINQYPLADEIGTSTTFTYKIPKSVTLKVSNEEIVDFYQPLVSGIEYYDYFKDGDSWYSSFDPGDLVPLNDIKELDFLVNTRRIIGITRKEISGYNYNFKYFGKLMAKIFPKECIVLYKEIT